MRLSRAFLLTLATRETALVCAFLNAIVLSRVLGAEAMGTYALVVTTANLLALVGSLGLNYSNTFLVAQRPETAGQLLTHSVLPVLLMGAVAAAIDLGWTWASDVIFGSLVPPLRVLTWAGALLLIVNLNLAYILYGLQRLKRHSLVTALTSAGTGLTNVIAIPLFKIDVTWALRVWLFWNVLTLLVTFALLCPVARPVWRIDRRLLGESIRVGFRALVSAVLGYASGRGVLILIERLLGLVSVGHYAVATQMAEVLQHAPSALGGLVFTKTSAEGTTAAKVAGILRLNWLASGVLGGALALAAPWLLRFLFEARGKEFSFAPAIVPFQILLLASYFSGVWTLASSYVGGRRGMPWGLVAITAASTACTILLCFSWIPAWGLEGAAWASAATAVVTALAMLGYFNRVAGPEIEGGALVPRPSDLADAWRAFRSPQ